MRILLRAAEIMLMAIAAVSVIVTAAQITERPVIGVIAGCLALASAIGIYFVDRRIKSLDTQKTVVIPEDLPTPVTILPGAKRVRLPLYGSLLFLGGSYGLLVDGQVILGTLGILLGSGAAVLLITAVLRRNVPALVIRDTGVETPDYGRIAWENIDRIHVSKVQRRHGVTHTLIIFLYDARRHLARSSPLRRWLSNFGDRDDQNKLQISLDGLRQNPDYIDAAIRKIRHRFASSIGIPLTTGDLSIDRRTAEIQRLMNSLDPADSIEQTKSAEKRMRELMAENTKELDDARKAIRRHQRKLFFQLLFGIAILLAWMIYRHVAK